MNDAAARLPAVVVLLALLALLVSLAGCAGPSPGPPIGTAPAAAIGPPSPSNLPRPSSAAEPQATAVTKLLTVVEENHSLAQMQAGMPYLDALAGRFGYASNWSAAGHPSLPNYLAIAGGATFGVTDDAPPANHPLPGDSVFDQALAEGRTAKIYADSMPGSCTPVSIGRYAVKHNPWAYFSEAGQRTNCQSYDVPAGSPDSGELASDITAGRLPNAGMLVPNLCDDGHDCSLATADAYLRSWLPQILAGPDFSSGRLAVVITADEDDSANGNHVLTVVLHHSLDGTGTVVRTPLNHYSLTRFYGQVDDTAPLRLAGSAPDLRAAFGLP